MPWRGHRAGVLAPTLKGATYNICYSTPLDQKWLWDWRLLSDSCGGFDRALADDVGQMGMARSMEGLLARIQHPILKRMVEFWNAKRDGRDWPLRSDFDPLEFWFAVGYVSLIEVSSATTGARRYFFRLDGTRQVELFGADFTNKFLDQVYDAEGLHLAEQSYGAAVDQGRGRHPAALQDRRPGGHADDGRHAGLGELSGRSFSRVRLCSASLVLACWFVMFVRPSRDAGKRRQGRRSGAGEPETGDFRGWDASSGQICSPKIVCSAPRALAV
jgi:hypothetical protein